MTLLDRVLALITALATVAAAFFAWRAAVAGQKSVKIGERAADAGERAAGSGDRAAAAGERAAVASESAVNIAQQAGREERAAQSLRQLERVGEALARVQGTADTMVRHGFPMGLPGMTPADAIAMEPIVAAGTAYYRSLEQLAVALASAPPEALPKCRQLAREERNPQGSRDQLPGAIAELTEAMKVAWAELNRLEG